MDMTRYLKPYLTVPELEAMGGEYDGVIASVTNEEIRNRYKGQKSNEPVVSFDDGKRLVLNAGMLRACLSWFGADSTNWIGRRIRLFLRRVETINRETGEIKVRLQRGILCEDPHFLSSSRTRSAAMVTVAPVRDRELAEDDGGVPVEEIFDKERQSS